MKREQYRQARAASTAGFRPATSEDPELLGALESLVERFTRRLPASGQSGDLSGPGDLLHDHGEKP